MTTEQTMENKYDKKLDKIMLPKNDLELHDKIQTLMWELIDKAIAEERKDIVEMIERAEFFDTQNGKYGQHLIRQAELINEHLMPHLKKTFINLIQNK